LTFSFFGNFARDMTYSIAWALFALVMLVAGIVQKVRAPAMRHWPCCVSPCLKLSSVISRTSTNLYRIGAFVGVAVVLLVASFCTRDSSRWRRRFREEACRYRITRGHQRLGATGRRGHAGGWCADFADRLELSEENHDQAEGVQQLDLDLETLAHAADDLRDMRIVREGQQYPYVIEHSDNPHSYVPIVDTVNDAKRSTMSSGRFACRPKARP